MHPLHHQWTIVEIIIFLKVALFKTYIKEKLHKILSVIFTDMLYSKINLIRMGKRTLYIPASTLDHKPYSK